MDDLDLINTYCSNSSQIMWFLGAGASRSAGLLTATDIIWDLKLKHYCREENHDIKSHDITNEIIKGRIQAYMNSRGYPDLWSSEEYSFYFELAFGTDYAAQQKYLAEILKSENLSLNVGHKVLAGLIGQNKARLIFTTNFDEVIESAYAKIIGGVLPTYHLEGSYGALDALNAERFPIYAKIHGDFKYRSIKNLASDLLENDRKIQECFLAASNRYGLIVTGYSGRDRNVMSMFEAALEQANAFPTGLYWTVPNLGAVLPPVEEFIAKAKGKGIRAEIIETGTFDSMLSRIWRQLPDRNQTYDQKIRSSRTSQVNIPMNPNGTSYPILRTNALPILHLPVNCAAVITTTPLSHKDVKDRILQNRSHAIIFSLDQILAWGNHQEISKGIGDSSITSISKHEITDPVTLISKDKRYHAFYERALMVALVEKKPLILRNDKGFFICIDHRVAENEIYKPLKRALRDRTGNDGIIKGVIPNSDNVGWSEAVSVKIEVRNNNLWLVLRPTIWIEAKADTKRMNHGDFLKNRRKNRYNRTANELLDAWINILFNNAAKGTSVNVTCYNGEDYPASFEINTRTSYSRK